MLFSKSTGCVVLLACGGVVATAGAEIVSTTGVEVLPIPESVARNVVTSDTTARLFEERLNQTIHQDAHVVARTPGTYGPATTDTQWQASRLDLDAPYRVSVYLLHADSIGDELVNYIGSITFKTPILGVNPGAALSTYDAILGVAPATAYPSLDSPGSRALEMDGTGPEGFDQFTISADRKTLSFDVAVSGGVDQLRIVTQTLLGDATGDDRVDFDDLLSLAQSYGKQTNATWEEGDFNVDGEVDFDDLLTLAQNYQSSSVSASDLPAKIREDFTLARSFVPEPMTLSVMSGLALRRRRAWTPTSGEAM